MIDELAGGVLGGLFRLLAGFLKDIVFDVFCYTAGWLTLKVLTLGQYPKNGLFSGAHQAAQEDDGDVLVSLVGLAVLLVLVFWLGFHPGGW